MQVHLTAHRFDSPAQIDPRFEVEVLVRYGGAVYYEPTIDSLKNWKHVFTPGDKNNLESTFEVTTKPIPDCRIIIPWDITIALGDMFDRFVFECKQRLVEMNYPEQVVSMTAEAIRNAAVDQASNSHATDWTMDYDLTYKTKYFHKPQNSFSQLVSQHDYFGYHISGKAGTDSFESLSKNLPGMNEMVNCPECIYEEFLSAKSVRKDRAPLWQMVQHLNDHHRWTRESIADWLDELHDNKVIDIEFDVPLEGGEE